MPSAVPPSRNAALLAGAYRRMAASSPLPPIGTGPAEWDEPGGVGVPGGSGGADGRDVTGGSGGPDDDWVPGRRLVEDAGVREALVAAEERRIRDTYGVRPRRDVAATWVLHRYAFTAVLAMSGPWYLERRVPRLVPDGVAYEGRTRRLVVTDAGEVSCLPGDPAAGLPGVRAVDGEEALRAALREAVAGHLEPVLEAFRPLVRRGARAMWGLVTDELAEGVRHLGRALGDEWAAARAVGELLPGGTPPFTGDAGFRPGPGERGEPVRTRAGCCLFYTIRPDEVCDACPRRTPGGPGGAGGAGGASGARGAGGAGRGPGRTG